MWSLSKWWENRKQQAAMIKNYVPKEKETVRKMFGLYCQKNHDTPAGKKLCPKCTALLATVMLKMNRCPYGITKPICEKCKIPCFGKKQTKDFLDIMQGSRTKMLLRHPIMAMRHRLNGMRREVTKEDIKKNAAKEKEKEKK